MLNHSTIQLSLFINHMLNHGTIQLSLFINHMLNHGTIQLSLFINHMLNHGTIQLPLFINHMLNHGTIQLSLFILLHQPLHCLGATKTLHYLNNIVIFPLNIPHWGNSYCRLKRSAMVSQLGFEPLTSRYRGRCSTLHWLEATKIVSPMPVRHQLTFWIVLTNSSL
jgi:hypothetical protein